MEMKEACNECPFSLWCIAQAGARPGLVIRGSCAKCGKKGVFLLRASVRPRPPALPVAVGYAPSTPCKRRERDEQAICPECAPTVRRSKK